MTTLGEDGVLRIGVGMKPKAAPAKQKQGAHYVEIVHASGLGRLHCPVCGKAIMDAEDGLNATLCKHVLLVHDWIGEFHARDSKVKALIEAAEGREDEEEEVSAIELLRSDFGPNVVFFEFLSPAYGPKDAEVLTVAVDLGMAEHVPSAPKGPRRR